MLRWIDTHCHLDAPEFAADALAVRQRAAGRGVALCVLAAVRASGFDACRELARRQGDAYALGIHPLATPHEPDDALARLDEALGRHAGDPHLVAVGEIGLDYFDENLRQPALAQRQQLFFTEQLKLARRHGLPVLLHTRRAADQALHSLRRIAVAGGIAHAFSGSRQQAGQFLALGLKLGFGGAATYPRATRLRALAAALPPEAIVLETDAPDMPPRWLRGPGQPPPRNEPGELPRIGAEIAALRGLPPEPWAAQTTANAIAALPRLAALLNR
jgi:TatD DNase family protein